MYVISDKMSSHFKKMVFSDRNDRDRNILDSYLLEVHLTS
jgi:hypothetical protein